MIDIQNQEDTRAVPLQKVGVKGVKYPVTVLDKKATSQQTTATVDLYVIFRIITRELTCHDL